MTRWFRPMGLSLRVQTEDAALLQVCTAMFGGFGPADPHGVPDFYFDLRLTSSANPAAYPSFRFEDGRAYAYAGCDCIISANLAESTVVGSISPALLREDSLLRHHYLQFALAVMLTARGYIGVHGAGLVKNGTKILVRGASGSGKSVLACAAIERGWQILSDSTVWLDTQGDWWGLPWWLRLRKSAAPLFPRLPLDCAPQIGDEKLEVLAEQICPESAVTHAAAGVVLFIERTPLGRSSVDTLTPTESQALWPVGEAGLETQAGGYAGRIGALLRLGALRLRFAQDLDEAVEAIDRVQPMGIKA
jgi:hypothetical protein